MHLLRTVPGLREVSIHPDGEHGKRFDIQGWLGKRGFTMKAAAGTTSYGGTYASPDGQIVVVNPSSGRGDVVAVGMPGSNRGSGRDCAKLSGSRSLRPAWTAGGTRTKVTDERVLDPTGDFDRHSTDEILGARTILNRDRQQKFSTWAK